MQTRNVCFHLGECNKGNQLMLKKYAQFIRRKTRESHVLDLHPHEKPARTKYSVP